MKLTRIVKIRINLSRVNSKFWIQSRLSWHLKPQLSYINALHTCRSVFFMIFKFSHEMICSSCDQKVFLFDNRINFLHFVIYPLFRVNFLLVSNFPFNSR